MAEHTPGPWAFDGPISNIHVYEAERPHMRVCFMTSDGRPRENARLIAAAPDMLAALTEMLDIIDQGDVSEVWQVALLKGRMAVAKARP